MPIGKRLEDILASRSENVNSIANQIKVSPQTIYSIIKRDNMKVDFDILVRLSKALHVSVEYFYEPNLIKGSNNNLTEPELSHIQKYRDLLPEYQKAADDNIKSLFELQTSIIREFLQSNSDRVVELHPQHPYYDMPVSAGTGVFLDSDNYELIDDTPETPAQTNFLVRVHGDSMEPKINDGEILYIKQQPAIEDGEIGIFLYDGNVYVKKQESKDGVYKLISLNPAYAPIEIVSGDCKCYGKVLNK